MVAGCFRSDIARSVAVKLAGCLLCISYAREQTGAVARVQRAAAAAAHPRLLAGAASRRLRTQPQPDAQSQPQPQPEPRPQSQPEPQLQSQVHPCPHTLAGIWKVHPGDLLSYFSTMSAILLGVPRVCTHQHGLKVSHVLLTRFTAHLCLSTPSQKATYCDTLRQRR